MKKSSNIINILFYVALIFIIAWAIAFLGYNAGGIIHVLLVIALIVLVIRIVRGSRIS